MKLRVQDAEKSGRKVIELKNASYRWGEQEMFSGLDCLIQRGDKLAILGPNGCGKTTLLKVMLKDLEPSSGTVLHGSNIKICRFDQLHAHVDLSQTVRENIADGGDWVEVDGRRQHVMGYLQNFLFSPDRAGVPAAHLSGGERNRLQLAKMFTKPGNVLVLDEPTNDLDMETLDLLVEKLADYPGTVLLVSHDRDFIDRVATMTLVYEEDQLAEYVGGYSDWLRQKEILDNAKPQKEETSLSKEPQASALSDEERKELFNLPRKIEQLEKEQSKIHDVMGRDGFYEKDAKEIEKWTQKCQKLEAEAAEAYERWETLEEKNS
jgi:ATP-binding cassette subfamily F protein uup